MSKRELGRSGLWVDPIAFGGNVFGWSADEATSFGLLDACVGLGLNLVDTADVYSAWAPGNAGGESEAIIGRWLKRSGRRDQLVIATKVAKWSRHPGLSPLNIQAAAEDSLRRLQTDVIDLYQAHADDPDVPLADTLGAFSRLIEQGKVRAIGASNYSAPRLAEALRVAEQHRLPRYETLQPEYNLYDRAGYEDALEPLVRDAGLGVISYYALASGFLTGKYRVAGDAGKSSARGAGVVDKYLNPRGLRILKVLDDVASAHAATVAQVALAWLIARPGITAPIVSATSVDQLRDIAVARTLVLSPAQIAALDAASAVAGSTPSSVTPAPGPERSGSQRTRTGATA
jgi:aryl-alcohol dehydrogenase-like predicted oxidoreductase